MDLTEAKKEEDLNRNFLCNAITIKICTKTFTWNLLGYGGDTTEDLVLQSAIILEPLNQ